MKTHVSVPHRSYPNSVRDAVEVKLQILAKYSERIESLRAVLDREHDLHCVELVVRVGRGATLVVDSKAGTFDEALDEALQRMKSLLTRNKKRLVQRHRHTKNEDL